MAENDGAPAAKAGAPTEKPGEDFTAQSNAARVADASDNASDDAVEAARRTCQTFLDAVRASGDIDAAGGYSAEVLSAISVVIACTAPDGRGRFLGRLMKTGVSPEEAMLFLGAVDRARTGRRLRLLTAEEVIALPEPEFLIDGLVVRGEEVVLYGGPNVGKTFVALDMAASVAAGIDWFDRPVVQGPVIYVAAEGIGGLGKRFRVWKVAHGIEELTDLYVIPDTVNLLDAGVIEEVLDLAREVEPLLVVFDTLARSMVGGDESSAKDMGLAIAAIDRIRQETGATQMLLHHTLKGTPNKGTPKVERGSSALRGAVDTMVRLDATAHGVILTCDKQRNFEAAPPIELSLAPVGESLVPRLVAPASGITGAADVKTTTTTAEIDRVLAEAEKAGETPLSQNALIKRVGGNTATVTKILQDHAADETSKITVTKSGNSLLYDWDA